MLQHPPLWVLIYLIIYFCSALDISYHIFIHHVVLLILPSLFYCYSQNGDGYTNMRWFASCDSQSLIGTYPVLCSYF